MLRIMNRIPYHSYIFVSVGIMENNASISNKQLVQPREEIYKQCDKVSECVSVEEKFQYNFQDHKQRV